MEDQRRNELLQRKQELIDKLTGLEGAETRRQYAEDRVKCAEMAQSVPGFPRPLRPEIEAAERDLKEATDECNRIDAELRAIDTELGIES
jgi:hypothetical protein